MATTTQLQYTLTIPAKEFNLIEPLAKKFKWLVAAEPVKAKTKDYTFNDLNDVSKKAFADIDAGQTFKAKNVADLMKQLNS
ncbi:MAG: hypothetical protein LBM68_06970 [Bacteroidales bacterium]|nr:hypothetical protein [Bacteroidales bacterium]